MMDDDINFDCLIWYLIIKQKFKLRIGNYFVLYKIEEMWLEIVFVM